MRPLLASLLLAASCSLQDPAGGATQVCSFFYRATTTCEGTGDDCPITLSERAVRHAAHGDGETFTLGEFEVTTALSSTPEEGSSLTVSVGVPGRTIQSHLFQLPEAVADQFAGGHGYSGLVYVNHPTSEGELQYFCGTGG